MAWLVPHTVKLFIETKNNNCCQQILIHDCIWLTGEESQVSNASVMIIQYRLFGDNQVLFQTKFNSHFFLSAFWQGRKMPC